MEKKINADTCHGCGTPFDDIRHEGLCTRCSQALKTIPSALSRFAELMQLVQRPDGDYVM